MRRIFAHIYTSVQTACLCPCLTCPLHMSPCVYPQASAGELLSLQWDLGLNPDERIYGLGQHKVPSH